MKELIQVQALWRGYRVRRNYLSRDLFLLAKETLDQCLDINTFPRASSGITKVYLPPHLPLVFKALGIQRSKKRFFTMWQAKDLCKKNGYKHLLIPSGRPYKEYNIEIKLPVHDVKLREQVALYQENHLNFTPAVREFSGLLCQCIFPDILTEFHPYQEEDKVPLGRCDNIPLLFDKSIGKIALIDLGGFQIRKENLSLCQALDCFRTAIFIFPYHFDNILEVVAKYCPEIISERVALQIFTDSVLFRFQKIYMEHRNFVEQEIHLKKRLKFSLERIKEIIQHIQKVADEGIRLPLNQEKIVLLIEQIMTPISLKLTASYSERPSLSSYVCSRYLTLKFNDLFTIFQNENSLTEIQHLLKIILDEFTGKEIFYANNYISRSQESLIRIHF